MKRQVKKIPVITFKKVSKDFTLHKEKKIKRDLFNPFKKELRGSIRVINNVSFKIYQGETVGLIGPNGSGKTTLFRLMAGILKQSTGAIDIKGRVAPLIELGSGFHQEFSGKENIYLNGSILGMTFKEVDKCMPSIIELAGKTVAKFIDQPLKHYSMGMKARLGFSVAIHTDPDILLIDESLSVGDFAFIEESMKKIKELQKQGKTIVMTSHNPEIIARICTRTITVVSGKVA